MGLLDLPLEVLDEIIALSLPDGIESLALSCKAIYQRAFSRIREHNTLKSQWRHVHINTTHYCNGFQILHIIERNPLIAQYIESITLSDRQDVGLNVFDPAEFDIFRSQESAMEDLKRMVVGSKWAALAGVDSNEWWETLKNEDNTEEDEEDLDPDPPEAPMCTLVALLAHLPNLKTLRLSPSWEHFGTDLRTDETNQKMLAILDVMVQNANQAQNNNTSLYPLANLTTILPFMPKGGNERAGLLTLEPFMRLKSLKEIYAVSCLAVDDGYTGIPFYWRFPGQVSSLTRLELAYCCIDADGLTELISHTPCLQVFKYSHQVKYHGCLYYWNPGTFNDALAQHCGQTITDLAITVDTSYCEIENGASSFLSFPNLKYLEVDVLIFCGPPVESGQRRGYHAHIPEGQKPWAHEDIPCIGSMIPDNIVEIHINTDYPEPDESALFALLKNIRPQRKERLHLLDKVTIRQYNADSAGVMAEKAEVRLEVFREDHLPRDMMPQWKREFVSKVGMEEGD